MLFRYLHCRSVTGAVRRETGKEQTVRVRYDEGVATHIGPEPCVSTREGAGEASAGERMGQPLSRKRLQIPGADAVVPAEGNTDGGVIAGTHLTRRGLRHWHVRKLLGREPGGLMSVLLQSSILARFVTIMPSKLNALNFPYAHQTQTLQQNPPKRRIIPSIIGNNTAPTARAVGFIPECHHGSKSLQMSGLVVPTTQKINARDESTT